MADFLGLMKQATQLQSKMQELQAELDSIEVEGTAGGGMVTVKLTAKGELKGTRIDDLSLTQFRDTVDPNSPAIVLFSPSGTAHPYYSEFGWVGAAGSTARIGTSRRSSAARCARNAASPSR